MIVKDLAAWLNRTYPGRDWDQQCARLVWNAVYRVSGVEESEMRAYDPAKAGYRASRIASLRADRAPAGAIHYFAHPEIEGHVAVDVGGGLVLMTGTPAALGDAGQMLGDNYGLTTIASYMNARGNPYLGWSRRYGSNPSIVGKLSLAPPKPTPKPTYRKAKHMLGLMITDGEGRYGAKGQRYFATYDGRSFVYLNEADANAVSTHLGKFANVTYTAWEQYQAAAEFVLAA